MKTLCVFTLFIAMATTAEAKQTPHVTEALKFFLNSCWEGKFVGSEDTDVHCFREMVDGRFVRDNHLVSSKKGKYGGETVFWWDEDGQHLKYTYWDTQGGISNGTMLPTTDGFESPDEVYEGTNGQRFTIRTRWLVNSGDEYTMESVKVDGNQTTRMFAIDYKRVPLRDCPGPICL